MKSDSILIVEDERHLADGLRFNLVAEGYRVEIAADGETALQALLLRREDYSAVVLDVMLPGIDGFAVASALRKAGQFVPVLMLTARGRPSDVLRGFESGADDYLPKPFELAILLARLRGLLRRREWSGRETQLAPRGAPVAAPQSNFTRSDERGFEAAQFRFAGRSLDFGSLELRGANGDMIHLTLMEANLLRHLIRNAGRVVSRKALLEEVWGLHEDTDTRAIDNFIVRLRKYIEDEPSRPKHLLTVRGMGYRFVPEPT